MTHRRVLESQTEVGTWFLGFEFPCELRRNFGWA